MRWLGVIAAALALATPASAAARDPQLLVLQHQIRQLQAQVAQLQTQLHLEQQHRVCDYALTQDAFRLTVFPALDKFSIFLTDQGVPAWEQIPRYDDRGACAAVGVSRP